MTVNPTAPGAGELPAIPYPGINPFGYAHRGVFFGRDKEKRVAGRTIVLRRSVVLFSGQGIGKSSLILAGIVPEAEREGYQPEIVRVQPVLDQEIVLRRIARHENGEAPYLPSIVPSAGGASTVVLSAREFERQLREAAQAVRPLIIFDQFEEWVTLFQRTPGAANEKSVKEAQDRIRDLIVSVVQSEHLPVKVLLALREDYLASLAPLFRRCPELTEHYLRLEPLSPDEVYRAIRGPLEECDGAYPDAIAGTTAARIRDELASASAAGEVRLGEVQIVCRTIFERALEGTPAEQTLQNSGDARGIIESYFTGTMESLGVDEREPAVSLLSQLLTPSGTRNIVSDDSLIRLVRNEEPSFSAELLRRTLQHLDSRARVVQSDLRRDVRYYEIASEFLVD